jgi:hypothetical protein
MGNVVSWHADERCEERGITAWQLVAGLAAQGSSGVEVIYLPDDPNEACLKPAIVRWLDEIAAKAAEGDVVYLQRVGRVFQAVTG